MVNKTLEQLLDSYLRERPLFLSLIRSKEAYLYQQFAPLPGPILDVGCGDGFFASVALPGLVNGKIIGLDLPDSRIAAAGQSGIYEKTITFNGTHIPFSDDYFSTVVSNCVLEHVADLAPLLSDIHRVLAQDGAFLTTVMARPWEEYLAGNLLLGNTYAAWMRRKQVHVNLLTQAQWEAAFAAAGFSIEACIGYLSPVACRLIDICHYVSFPSLLSYGITGRWVLLPSLTTLFYPRRLLSRILVRDVSPERSGAIFYRLRRTKKVAASSRRTSRTRL